jgi:pyruvate dehydrogenase E2 component (dihydrolipoamide acetyltransferase)
MQHEMKLPDLATTGSAVKIVRWLREPGHVVRRGEALLEIETDKATMEVEATVDGQLAALCAAVGDEVVTGDLIALIETVGESARVETRSDRRGPSATATRGAPSDLLGVSTAAAASRARSSDTGGMFARNRQAARQPTPGASHAPQTELTLSPAQRITARRLQASKQTVPHFYVERSACADTLLARRKASTEPSLLWDAFFAQAVSRALVAFPRIACRFAEDRLEPVASEAIGVAVDLQGDLYVVALDAPATRSVEELSRDLRASVDALRRGNPEARRLRPGRITISNLGSTGIERFTAIVNPPEAAILAIGAIRPVVVPRGEVIAVEQRVTLTLSVDHRVVSGRYASEFLAAVVDALERP